MLQNPPQSPVGIATQRDDLCARLEIRKSAIQLQDFLAASLH